MELFKIPSPIFIHAHKRVVLIEYFIGYIILKYYTLYIPITSFKKM